MLIFLPDNYLRYLEAEGGRDGEKCRNQFLSNVRVRIKQVIRIYEMSSLVGSPGLCDCVYTE